MKEKLIIRNFGPIKNVELELGRFNVLIGEQATGKSTVAKLLAVCRYFSYIIDPEIFRTADESWFEEGLNAWGLNGFTTKDSYIYYESEHYSFTVKKEYNSETLLDEDGHIQQEIKFEYFVPKITSNSQEFKNLLTQLEAIKPVHDEQYGFYDVNWIIPISFYQNYVAKVLDNPFYLPTERGLQSIFSLGKNSIPNISDSLFNQFARMDQFARFFKKDTQLNL